METPPFTLPTVRTHRALLADGVSDPEIRAALAAGTLVRVRRGCYVNGPLDPGQEARAAVVARVAAVAGQGAGPAVFSHATAAALWGLPFLGDPPETIHLTVPSSAHGARRSALHVHAGDLVPEETVEHRGIRLTSLARTLVDVARSEGFRQGVVMADHALRLHPDPDALRAAMGASIDRSATCAGVARARRTLEFAVPEAESPGESLSRVVFREQNVPVPILQYRLVVRLPGGGRGDFRTDFAWEQQEMVGEFDGAAKYHRYLAPGETPGDAVAREKQREDMIRAAGWGVVRWTWSELQRPVTLARRVREVLQARS